MPRPHTSLHPENPVGRGVYRWDKIQVGLVHPCIKVDQLQDQSEDINLYKATLA